MGQSAVDEAVAILFKIEARASITAEEASRLAELLSNETIAKAAVADLKIELRRRLLQSAAQFVLDGAEARLRERASPKGQTSMTDDRRPGWDQFFLNLATTLSARATCSRKQVGAVLARDNTFLSGGYNGSPRGRPHCLDVGCEMEDGHCVRTVHAEANAITHAARNGVNIKGATLYSTASPCYACAKLLVNAGVRRVVFGEKYRPDERCDGLFREADIEVVSGVAPV